MNVLQLINSGSGFYGAERVVVTLSSELRKVGVNVVVGAFRHRVRQPHLEVLEEAHNCGLTTIEIPYTGRLDRAAVASLNTLIEHNKIDVIHSHEQTANFYAALTAPRRKTRLVGTCHNWLINCFKDWVVSAVDRVILRRFDAVVVVHGSTEAQLRRFGVRKRRICTIPNGIDLGCFSPAAYSIMNDRPRNGGMVVGTVARLAPEKGLKYLLEAASVILQEYPLTNFIIIGEGPESAALQARTHSLGINERVQFVGTRTDMPRAYASFDIFVLPSLTEAMPMSLMEAMASEKAVIATSVGSVPEMIRDRKNGIIVKSACSGSLVEALRDLLSSAEVRMALGLAAKATAASFFSSAVMARRYLSVYESVTADPTGIVRRRAAGRRQK